MSDQQIDSKLKALFDSYKQSLPDKISKIQKAFDELNQDWTQANFKNFYSLIHNLSGSAATYGFRDLGEIASQIEKKIRTDDDKTPLNQTIMNQIKENIAALNKVHSSFTTEVGDLYLQTIHTDLIYLLDSGLDYTFGTEWVNDIKNQLSMFGYTLCSFTDIGSLLKELNNKKPLALIVNFDFLFNAFDVNMTNTTVQQEFNQQFKNTYTIFLSKSGEFEKRLEAFRMGCKNFFLLPFNINQLISELDNVKYLWDGTFKAIIVDDDEEILNYYSNLLTKANITNKKIKTWQNLENQLHEFQPDIFLFDLQMPNCNGIELAGIIRQQKKYEHIPIIFLSTEENKTIQLQAMKVGADDFITKATDPNYIIKTIRARAARYKKIKALINKDNLTNAFIFEYIVEELEKFIRFYKKFNYHLTIGIIKIDNFQMITKSYTLSAGDQLLNNLYILLNSQLDPSRVIGRYLANKFIVIFPKTNLEEALQEMNKIQSKFRSSLHYADGKAYGSTFSIGLATYQAGETINDFIARADKNIGKAPRGKSPT